MGICEEAGRWLERGEPVKAVRAERKATGDDLKEAWARVQADPRYSAPRESPNQRMARDLSAAEERLDRLADLVGAEGEGSLRWADAEQRIGVDT